LKLQKKEGVVSRASLSKRGDQVGGRKRRVSGEKIWTMAPNKSIQSPDFAKKAIKKERRVEKAQTTNGTQPLAARNPLRKRHENRSPGKGEKEGGP